ncbi:MAG TPA: peroxiredoxin family protein [Planctomycetota bacterium]|jgi:peroxiredoxin|nr:peroxiredoxin family protein [Planctomycetota bacterium]
MSCRAELRGLGAVYEALAERGGQLLAISVDPPGTSKTLIKELALPFPILSDGDRRVVREYGLLHAGAAPDGGDVAIPAHFLVDRDGGIRWRHVARRVQDRPLPGEVLEALAGTP